ncbi:hypothetical protein B484DRAFT_240155 [Ochromonadaceae sp. CCMP2298]|nr:hypothetical protein B484DRAFT_240155 [Ochromonadaceae sp. CCMP2298]
MSLTPRGAPFFEERKRGQLADAAVESEALREDGAALQQLEHSREDLGATTATSAEAATAEAATEAAEAAAEAAAAEAATAEAAAAEAATAEAAAELLEAKRQLAQAMANKEFKQCGVLQAQASRLEARLLEGAGAVVPAAQLRQHRIKLEADMAQALADQHFDRCGSGSGARVASASAKSGARVGAGGSGPSELEWLVTALDSESILDVAKKMAGSRADAALLLGADGSLSGILTDNDVTRRVVSQFINPSEAAVSSVMTRNPKCVHASESALDALEMMVDNRFRHLPVLDGEGVVVGLLDIAKSLYDAISVLEKVQGEEGGGSGSGGAGAGCIQSRGQELELLMQVYTAPAASDASASGLAATALMGGVEAVAPVAAAAAQAAAEPAAEKGAEAAAEKGAADKAERCRLLWRCGGSAHTAERVYSKLALCERRQRGRKRHLLLLLQRW